MISSSSQSSWNEDASSSASARVGWRILPPKPVPFHPGPMRLAAAAALAGFSQDNALPTVWAVNGVEWDNNNELLTALAICSGECGGDVFITSYHPNKDGSLDCGAWQINNRWHPEWFRSDSLLSPYGLNWAIPTDNAIMAYTVFKQAGHSFRPWNSFTAGARTSPAYRGYLDWHLKPASLTRMEWAQGGIDQMNIELGKGRSLRSIAMTYLETYTL